MIITYTGQNRNPSVKGATVIKRTIEKVNGVNGLSAFEEYKLKTGNNAITYNEFLFSLKGKDGKDGKDGVNGTNGKDGINGVNGINGVDGADGKDGVDGKDGTNGINGANGVDGKDGVNGTNGINGTNGLSAFELWKLDKNLPSATYQDYEADMRVPLELGISIVNGRLIVATNAENNISLINGRLIIR